jgi:hypothetical protein
MESILRKFLLQLAEGNTNAVRLVLLYLLTNRKNFYHVIQFSL